MLGANVQQHLEVLGELAIAAAEGRMRSGSGHGTCCPVAGRTGKRSWGWGVVALAAGKQSDVGR